MKTATIILLGSISCLVGCDSRTSPDGNVSNPPARPGHFASTNIVDIKENIRLMCDSLEKKGATAEFYGLASNLYNSMTSITDATVAVMLCDARLDALFSVDFSHFSYKEQAVIDELIGRSVDNAFEYLKGVKRSYAQHRKLWFEKHIEYEIKYLKWKRRLVMRLRPKHRIENPNLVLDVEADDERRAWCGLYYNGMNDCEWRTGNLESLFPHWARGIPPDTVARVKAMLEEHLGRPIRTEKQLREDHEQKRRVEYFEEPDPHAAP